MMEFRLFLADGITNLVVVVSFLIFSIGLIPMILWAGAPGRSRQAEGATTPKSDR